MIISKIYPQLVFSITIIKFGLIDKFIYLGLG